MAEAALEPMEAEVGPGVSEPDMLEAVKSPPKSAALEEAAANFPFSARPRRNNAKKTKPKEKKPS